MAEVVAENKVVSRSTTALLSEIKDLNLLLAGQKGKLEREDIVELCLKYNSERSKEERFYIGNIIAKQLQTVLEKITKSVTPITSGLSLADNLLLFLSKLQVSDPTFHFEKLAAELSYRKTVEHTFGWRELNKDKYVWLKESPIKLFKIACSLKKSEARDGQLLKATSALFEIAIADSDRLLSGESESKLFYLIPGKEKVEVSSQTASIFKQFFSVVKTLSKADQEVVLSTAFEALINRKLVFANRRELTFSRAFNNSISGMELGEISGIMNKLNVVIDDFTRDNLNNIDSRKVSKKVVGHLESLLIDLKDTISKSRVSLTKTQRTYLLNSVSNVVSIVLHGDAATACDIHKRLVGSLEGFKAEFPEDLNLWRSFSLPAISGCGSSLDPQQNNRALAIGKFLGDVGENVGGPNSSEKYLTVIDIKREAAERAANPNFKLSNIAATFIIELGIAATGVVGMAIDYSAARSRALEEMRQKLLATKRDRFHSVLDKGMSGIQVIRVQHQLEGSGSSFVDLPAGIYFGRLNAPSTNQQLLVIPCPLTGISLRQNQFHIEQRHNSNPKSLFAAALGLMDGDRELITLAPHPRLLKPTLRTADDWQKYFESDHYVFNKDRSVDVKMKSAWFNSLSPHLKENVDGLNILFLGSGPGTEISLFFKKFPQLLGKVNLFAIDAHVAPNQYINSAHATRTPVTYLQGDLREIPTVLDQAGLTNKMNLVIGFGILDLQTFNYAEGRKIIDGVRAAAAPDHIGLYAPTGYNLYEGSDWKRMGFKVLAGSTVAEQANQDNMGLTQLLRYFNSGHIVQHDPSSSPTYPRPESERFQGSQNWNRKDMMKLNALVIESIDGRR